MTELIVQTTAGGPPAFRGPSADLVYFLSFAAAERYGSQHELSQAVTLLRHQHKVPLGPLLRFTDIRAESDADRQEQERLWQDPAALADAVERLIQAFQASRKVQELCSGFPEILPRLEDLRDQARWAAERGARIRLLYTLD
ncbi:MAG TPA: hypothetical protein VIO14_02350 [Dehalococcoidia bacterium]